MIEENNNQTQTNNSNVIYKKKKKNKDAVIYSISTNLNSFDQSHLPRVKKKGENYNRSTKVISLCAIVIDFTLMKYVTVTSNLIWHHRGIESSQNRSDSWSK